LAIPPGDGPDRFLNWALQEVTNARQSAIAVALLLTTVVSCFGGVVFVGRVISIVNGGTEAVLSVEPSRYDNTGMTLTRILPCMYTQTLAMPLMEIDSSS
jgi:hypothetical protein